MNKSFIFFGGKGIGNYVLNRLISENKEPKAVVYYRDYLNSNLLIFNSNDLFSRLF